MPNPQLGRTELHDLTAARIPDDPLDHITPAAVREVVDNIIDSTVNRADDGTPTGSTPPTETREYAVILPGHWGPNDPPTALLTLNQALDYLHDGTTPAPSPTGTTIVATDLPGARQLLAAGQVTRAALYVINGNWNNTGTTSRVYVQGLDTDGFSPVGTLRSASGAYSFVKVNVTDGTTQLALPVTQGSQITQGQLLSLLEAGEGITITAHEGRVLISSTVASVPSPVRPVAPTDGQVDDRANTFSGVAVPGFASYADYVYFTPASGGVQPLVAPIGYQAGNRIVLSGLSGDYLPGDVGIAVAASGNRPQGVFLVNQTGFTSAGGGGTITPGPSSGTPGILVYPSTAY
jgi:hypothetical protein